MGLCDVELKIEINLNMKIFLIALSFIETLRSHKTKILTRTSRYEEDHIK